MENNKKIDLLLQSSAAPHPSKEKLQKLRRREREMINKKRLS